MQFLHCCLGSSSPFAPDLLLCLRAHFFPTAAAASRKHATKLHNNEKKKSKIIYFSPGLARRQRRKLKQPHAGGRNNFFDSQEIYSWKIPRLFAVPRFQHRS